MARQGETTLRRFKDFDDLFDNVENEQIVAWLNEYADVKPHYDKLCKAEEKRSGYHKVYQERKKLLVKAMQERLDPDELARIKQLAENTVAGKEGDEP